MLYASALFRQLDQGKIAVEENPDDIPDLVAEILARAVERRLLRSLSFGYQPREAELGRVRGRIDFLSTERRQLLARGKIACRFEDLTVNTPRNCFVRAALDAIAGIVHRPDLAHRCRALAGGLKRIGVTGEKPSRNVLSVDRFGRHDADDKHMVAAAHLAFNLALPTEAAGDKLLTLPDREITWVRKLYEKAVAGFYDVVLSPNGWRVDAGKAIGWLIDKKTSGIDKILPSMRTDVVLDHHGCGQRIVIDTKFTSIVTRGWYREETLRSGYIYQIYAYLRSQEDNKDPLAPHASGLLLHPSVGCMANESVVIQGHEIRFATVDLGAEAKEIRKQLLRVVGSPIPDERDNGRLKEQPAEDALDSKVKTGLSEEIFYKHPISIPEQNVVDTAQDDLRLAEQLYELQKRSRYAGSGYRQFEAEMDRLAALLTTEKDQLVTTVAGDDWWLEVGPVNLDSKIVTIQRCDELIAAITARDDGRLRVAVFRPLDAKSADYLIGLGQAPHPDGGVCIRENNWEYALDCAAGAGNSYSADRGEAYLSFWDNGIGINPDGTENQVYHPCKDLSPRCTTVVVTELGVYCELSSKQRIDSPDQSEPTKEPSTAFVPTWRSKRHQRRTIKERFLGCLLGGAVGDALGAPVEFMKREDILQRFGPDGITTYAPAYGGLGAITDDTQMTLFTAEGLIRAWVRGRFKGITTYSGMTARAYLRWLHTQGERAAYDIDFDGEGAGWLMQQQALHSRRAPGNTCLSALRAMTTPGDQARNDSKGCGGVMRIAPVGLFAWRLRNDYTPHDAFRLGMDLAAITHGHPTGILTGGVLAVLIMALTDGATLSESIDAAKVCLRQEARHEETLRAIELAEELSTGDIPHNNAIDRIGQGWIAEEALAISIYCTLVANNFRQGLILAVNHDGDSDSTGSITGNLLGTIYGVKAIPQEWLEPLELRNIITELAEDLCAFRDWEIGEYSNNDELNRMIWRKYPGF
jgi:ADP-ribosylglycohydrolase/5-methylcytosine-specific restriction endonuclease McrBC regulatory subunit McrC